MSRIYGSSSSDEDEDKNRWRKNPFFKGNKTSGRAGPSDRFRKKRTQKHQDPALPEHLDTCDYYRNEELLQLGTFLEEDDPLVSSHKGKKNRSEPREVATADDPLEAKRPKTYLVIDISDDEDTNFNSVKTEFHYHDFKQNEGENDGALDEMTDDMTEQSISYPPSPSLSPEVKNVLELSKPVQNVENTDVLNVVLDEVMQQCVFYPLRTSTNEEIDPLLSENDSQLSGSPSNIQEERVLDQVMDEIMKQPTPYSSRTSVKPEISESSESEDKMNNTRVWSSAMGDVMTQSIPYFLETSLPSGSPSNIQEERVLDQVMDEIMKQPTPYSSRTSMKPEISESSESEDKMNNTRGWGSAIGDVMTQSIPYFLETSLPSESESPSSVSRTNIKNERISDQMVDEDREQLITYSSGALIKPEISPIKLEDGSELSESEYRMNNRTVLDTSTDEVMGWSLSEVSSISHHREIDPLGSECESQSLKPEQTITNDNTSALQTPSVSPISSLSDHREIDLLSPKTEPQSQESNDLENHTTLELIMDDVMNQASIKNEKITSGNLRQRDRSPGSSDYTESPPSRRSPHRVLNDTQSSSDLDRLIDRALECRLSSVSSDYSESTTSRTRHDQVTNDTPWSSSLDRCIDEALESQLSSIASTYSKPVSSRRRYRAVSGTQSSSYLDRLIDRALEGRLSSISPNQSKVPSPRRSRHRIENDPKSPPDNRLINRFCENRSVSIVPDSNQCFVHDQNALGFIRERPLESDDDEDDDEFTPAARPESIVQANVDDSSVIPNRENNETTCHRRRDPQIKYYPRKHFSLNENKAMIDILISDDEIQRATTLSYWQNIALLQLEALKGRSGKSLFNHFMRFLLPKRYAGYVKDPFALARLDAMYEEWVHRSRI